MEDNSTFFEVPGEGADSALSAPKLIHRSERGFCELYRINRQGRFHVLKCLKKEYRGSKLYEGILRKEFEIGYSLDHPNICTFYGYHTETRFGNCIEMEWIDGLPLDTFLEQNHTDRAQQEKMLEELCDALSYIHSKQIIHRDLKPSNILVTHKGGTVKLIDFGLSDSDRHSVLKASAGTAGYSAPEVLAGQEADVRSDIYSLGIIMFFFSRSFRSVAHKCCNRRPSRRFGSAQEVKKALRRHTSILPGLLFIALVSAIVLYPYVGRFFQRPEDVSPAHEDSLATAPADSLPSEPVSPVTDKVVPIPVKSNAEPAVTKDETVDEAVIDELFRQATELFGSEGD